MLTMQEALQILEGGDWVSLRFITADVLKGTGGKVLELAKCRIARRHNKTAAATKTTATNNQSRNPNHSLHFTRNVELPNKQLRKVHPILITHINNQPIV